MTVKSRDVGVIALARDASSVPHIARHHTLAQYRTSHPIRYLSTATIALGAYTKPVPDTA
eukprot:2954765-Rhodomonas_salina.3